MKRILYVIPGLNPSRNDGASNRCNSFISCFADNGYEVTCLALTNYKDYLEAYRHRSTYTSKAKWKLLPHLYFLDNRMKNIYLIFEKLYIFILNLFNAYDFILADYATGADIVSWVKGKTKIIVNYRGDQIDEHIMLHQCSESCPSVGNLRRLLRKSVQIADYSISVSEQLQQNVEEYAGCALKANYIFPCCADISRFKGIKEREDFEGRIVLGYFGGLSKWQCIDAVIEMAIALNRMDGRYLLLILTNSPTDDILARLEELGTDNYMIRSIGFSEVPLWISKMDISFNLREDRPLNTVSSPTKLSESLAAGVPVVVTEFSGDYKEIVVDGRTGVVLRDLKASDENLRKVDSFIQYKLTDDEKVRESCRAAVKNRTWQQYSLGLINFLESR
jgi:glycosyltransferase involved in cell wall biosynthesis